MDFSLLHAGFERQGWKRSHNPEHGNEWVKEGTVVRFDNGMFTLNCEAADEKKVYELLHITPRQVEVSEAIAPRPLYARYGRAFLDGVEWTDAFLAHKKESCNPEPTHSMKHDAIPMLIRYTLEKEGWTILHIFMSGYRYIKGKDKLTGDFRKMKLNNKEVTDEEICNLLDIDGRRVCMFKTLRAQWLTGGSYTQAFLEGVEWADASIATEIRQVVESEKRQTEKEEDGLFAEYQPLFDKRDEILEHPERYGETITTFSRTRVKDGFVTLPVWIKDVTVAELAQCWQREEYKTTCEECGGEAYIAGWNGLYKMGRFGVFQSLTECCPTCKRVYERHKTIGPAGLLEEGGLLECVNV